ncbi:MAG: beta-ketoacyl-[acyl-carrier-protein] synthase family protein [Actinomycetia bacterium]|nr:beta-ketoacyl-[acyl-carrier-protein] synthase family protein [Actinomycetes bacterium]
MGSSTSQRIIGGGFIGGNLPVGATFRRKGPGGYVVDLAITGLGAVSPIGVSADELCDNLLAGRIGIRTAPWAAQDGGDLYGAVDDAFDPNRWMDERVVAGTDGFSRFALAACNQAIADAGLESADLDGQRTGVVHGTSMGGHFSVARAQWDFDRGGGGAIDPKTQIKIWPNMAAAQICMAHDLHGPSLTVTTACASSLDALGTAAMYLESGRADVVLVGGTEGGYTCDPGQEHFQAAVNAAEQSYGMSSGPTDPSRAMLPFAADRAGIVSGEGSAFFVLETEDHARSRGASIRGWLRGYGSLADAHHPSSPEPEGRWEQLVMEQAQASAGIAPAAVDALVAHATGTPKGDTAEIRALNRVFVANDDLVVTGLKGHTAHTGASSGAMNIMAGLRAMDQGRLVNVAGTTVLDPEIEFDVVIHEPRAVDVGVLQVNSFGFGGQNASVIIGREQGPAR